MGSNLSSVRVKNMIKEVVAEEDPSNPYTDDQMVQVLMRKNAKIARRTITKYRKELNIPPASKRKKFFWPNHSDFLIKFISSLKSLYTSF